MNESETLLDTPIEPKIKKIYRICGLIQNIFFGAFIILDLFIIISKSLLLTENFVLFGGIFTKIGSWKLAGTKAPFFTLVGLLPSALFIIIGVGLFILFLMSTSDNAKKIYWIKFILRGILGIILILIIYFALEFISLFGLEPSPYSFPNVYRIIDLI